MKQNKNIKFKHLTITERGSIEHALNQQKSAHLIAESLDRSVSTITDEVKRNRIVTKGSDKGSLVTKMPDDVCPKLLEWPRVCNGCKNYHYHCRKNWRCEYIAPVAQKKSLEILTESRKGVNKTEFDFENAMATIRSDVKRGLSPTQIASARADRFKVSFSTIYRWIDKGYCGMSNAELRRKVKYKPRKKKSIGITTHGYERSYSAFSKLDREIRDSACEMDTVIGKLSDSQVILSLYLRPFKLQFYLLLKEKTSSNVAHSLDVLENVFGKKLFKQLFDVILTDNGKEFSDYLSLEKSAFKGTTRTQVYYCDPRQAQQKGSCEKAHVELRKILPKRRGISFDNLTERDMAYLMSMVNSEPRPSLMGLSPLELFKQALGKDAQTVMDALGISFVDYKDLNLMLAGLNHDRIQRGEPMLP